MKKSRVLRSIISSLAMLLFVLTFYACDSASSGSGGKKQNLSYKVIKIKRSAQKVDAILEFQAGIEAGQLIEIRPRVDGYVENIYVSENAAVKKGQALFRINGDVFTQQIKTSEADVLVAEANVRNAELDVKKVAPLVEQGIISHVELDSKNSSLTAAKARLAQAKAALANAKTNLANTGVNAPENGTVGKINVRKGSPVKFMDEEPLAVISSSQNMYAVFKTNKDTALALSKGESMDMVLLMDTMVYKHKGKLEIPVGIAEQKTDTVQLKALFPNPDAVLKANAAVRLKAPVSFENAIVIPQKASYGAEGKTMLMVVDSANVVHPREIEIEAVKGSDYIVKKGLKEGDVVVIEGVDKLKDGDLITPDFGDKTRKAVAAKKVPAADTARAKQVKTPADTLKKEAAKPAATQAKQAAAQPKPAAKAQVKPTTATTQTKPVATQTKATTVQVKPATTTQAKPAATQSKPATKTQTKPAATGKK